MQLSLARKRREAARAAPVRPEGRALLQRFATHNRLKGPKDKLPITIVAAPTHGRALPSVPPEGRGGPSGPCQSLEAEALATLLPVRPVGGTALLIYSR